MSLGSCVEYIYHEKKNSNANTRGKNEVVVDNNDQVPSELCHFGSLLPQKKGIRGIEMLPFLGRDKMRNDGKQGNGVLRWFESKASHELWCQCDPRQKKNVIGPP
jgi:hypothetical protein